MPADQVVAAVTAPPVGTSDLEALLHRLLPTAPVPTSPPQPRPTVRSADPDDDTAAPDWDYGNGSLVEAPASGDAGYGGDRLLLTRTGLR